MSRKHDAWLKSAVAAAHPGKTFFLSDEGLPAAVVPFVVIHPSDGVDSSDRLAGGAFTGNPRWTVHSVGSTVEQAQWAFEQWKKRLVVRGLGVVPVIAGEFPGRVEVSSPTPVQKDDDPNPSQYYHVAEVELSTQLFS